VRRLSGWALPIILGVAGVALIIAGSLELDGEPAQTVSPIARPTGTPTATASPPRTATHEESPSAGGTPAEPTESPTATPTATPLPDDVTAVGIEVEAVGIDVAVRHSASDQTDRFPPGDAAYILSSSSQPGRNESSYVFAHAVSSLFKPLWNARIGDRVVVRMSDGSALRYEITEVRPNVPCPDTDAPPAVDPPLALQIHDDCDEGSFWLAPTGYERLTLQTSQGFNRNWGELVIVAEPVR
jgi:hypothetical protein